ncbi:MAG: nitroreductase family protein [Acidaminococcaceae bacterium]|nr:nitroreductase family protein [Acidaminococcaceae bacterium]
MEFYEAIKTRRTRYDIDSTATIGDNRIEEILRDAVKNAPSAFNSQSSRAILLLGENHVKLWSIVKEILCSKVSEENFAPTDAKINSFAAGHGTILYYEDMAVIKNMQEAVPTYADNFPVWSMQSAGMLQYVVWTALATEGMGASLQHYNPIIDEEVAQVFSVPKSWKLIAQMPFGSPTGEPAELEYMDLANRVLVKK